MVQVLQTSLVHKRGYWQFHPVTKNDNLSDILKNFKMLAKCLTSTQTKQVYKNGIASMDSLVVCGWVGPVFFIFDKK